MMQNVRSKKSVGVRCDIMPVYNNIKQTENMKQPVIKKETYFSRLRWEQKNRKEKH